MAIIVEGFSPWTPICTGQSVSAGLALSEQAGGVLIKNWVIPPGLPQPLTHGTNHPSSGIERFGPLKIPVSTGGETMPPGFPLPGSSFSASAVAHVGGTIARPAGIPARDSLADIEKLSASESTPPSSGRGERTWIGWNQSGYEIGRQNDRNITRGRYETSVSKHEITFTLTDRSGGQFSFVITDALSLQDNGPIYSIHGRNVKATAIPPGMELIGIENDQTVADYAEDEVFIEPNLNHLCAIHLRGTEADYPGLEMVLLIGCVNRNGLERSYLHKKLVGLVISGVNPQTGTPWKNEFNSHLLRAEMCPEGSFRVEGGRVRIGGFWDDHSGFKLDDETTEEGYALAEDPLGRADHALIVPPDSRGGGLVIHVPSGRENVPPVVLRALPAERSFSVWQFKLGPRQHPLSVRREGDKVTISFGGGNVHRYSETIYLLEAPRKAGPANPYFLLVVRDDSEPLLFELDVAHYMAYRYVQTPELTDNKGVEVTELNQTGGRYNVEFMDREMNVRFYLNGIVIPEGGEEVNLSGIKGLAIDLGGAGAGSEPVEIFHDGQAIIVPGFARYEIEVVRNGDGIRLNINRTLIGESEGEEWVLVQR